MSGNRETIDQIAKRIAESDLEHADSEQFAAWISEQLRKWVSSRLVGNSVRRAVKPLAPTVGVASVLRAVSLAFDVANKEILSKDRAPSIVDARMAAAYLLRERLRYSFPEIGRFLACRDHTTIMSAHTRVARLLETETERAIKVKRGIARVNAILDAEADETEAARLSRSAAE